MTIRKHSNRVAPGCGIDGTEGEDFTKKGGNPWDSNPRGDYLSAAGAGKYQARAASFLRNKLPDENPDQGLTNAGSRDIFDAVEGQSSDDGNRAVRSGSKD